MNPFLVGSGLVFAAALWLIVLVLTSFNGVAVAVGLLAALSITGNKARPTHHKH